MVQNLEYVSGRAAGRLGIGSLFVFLSANGVDLAIPQELKDVLENTPFDTDEPLLWFTFALIFLVRSWWKNVPITPDERKAQELIVTFKSENTFEMTVNMEKVWAYRKAAFGKLAVSVLILTLYTFSDVDLTSLLIENGSELENVQSLEATFVSLFTLFSNWLTDAPVTKTAIEAKEQSKSVTNERLNERLQQLEETIAEMEKSGGAEEKVEKIEFREGAD